MPLMWFGNKKKVGETDDAVPNSFSDGQIANGHNKHNVELPQGIHQNGKLIQTNGLHNSHTGSEKRLKDKDSFKSRMPWSRSKEKRISSPNINGTAVITTTNGATRHKTDLHPNGENRSVKFSKESETPLVCDRTITSPSCTMTPVVHPHKYNNYANGSILPVQNGTVKPQPGQQQRSIDDFEVAAATVAESIKKHCNSSIRNEAFCPVKEYIDASQTTGLNSTGKSNRLGLSNSNRDSEIIADKNVYDLMLDNCVMTCDLLQKNLDDYIEVVRSHSNQQSPGSKQ